MSAVIIKNNVLSPGCLVWNHLTSLKNVAIPLPRHRQLFCFHASCAVTALACSVVVGLWHCKPGFLPYERRLWSSQGCQLRSRYKVSNLSFYDHLLMSELGFQIVIGSPDNCRLKFSWTWLTSLLDSVLGSVLCSPSYRFASDPSPLRNPE